MKPPPQSGSGIDYDPGSYRDRSSRVFRRGEHVYRGLSAQAAQAWNFVRNTAFFQRYMQSGKIIETVEIHDHPPGDWSAVLGHARIPVISYAYEWSFHMLKGAAQLHLDLLLDGLEEDVILKDATPFNVQFIGSRQVFIDIGSFERFQPGQAWQGYRQFCQTMLYPLMLQCYCEHPFHPWLRGSLQGVTPQQCLNLLSTRDMFRSGVLSHVYLHAKLDRSYSEKPNRLSESLGNNGFDKSHIQNNLRGLKKLLDKLTWKSTRSTWSDYDHNSEPVARDAQAKEDFLRKVVQLKRRQQVWDIGCNAGRYSRIAAENADYVIALDNDHLTVDRLFLSLQESGPQNILPLVYNIADPSPALGWRCTERSPLADRTQPDLIICLAVIHHLVLRENILLPDLISWLAQFRAELVIEFVDKQDPQAQQLIMNRVDQYTDYTQAQFERGLSAHFSILSQLSLTSGSRILYHAVPLGMTS